MTVAIIMQGRIGKSEQLSPPVRAPKALSIVLQVGNPNAQFEHF